MHQSPAVQRYVEALRKLLEYRARNNLYHIEDPRCGDPDVEDDGYASLSFKIDVAAAELSQEELDFLEPMGGWEDLMIRASNEMLQGMPPTPLPVPSCKIIGHVRSAEESGRTYFNCMECFARIEMATDDPSTVFFPNKPEA